MQEGMWPLTYLLADVRRTRLGKPRRNYNYEGSEVFEAQGWQLVHHEGGQESTHSMVQEVITPVEEYAEWEEGAVDAGNPLDQLNEARGRAVCFAPCRICD